MVIIHYDLVSMPGITQGVCCTLVEKVDVLPETLASIVKQAGLMGGEIRDAL